MIRKHIISYALLLLSVSSNAQDALFSLYQYTPTYMNPGLIGTGKNNLRLSAVTKVQWFNLYKPFK